MVDKTTDKIKPIGNVFLGHLNVIREHYRFCSGLCHLIELKHPGSSCNKKSLKGSTDRINKITEEYKNIYNTACAIQENINTVCSMIFSMSPEVLIRQLYDLRKITKHHQYFDKTVELSSTPFELYIILYHIKKMEPVLENLYDDVFRDKCTQKDQPEVF